MSHPLVLKNITKTFEDRPGERLVALQNISLEIMPGEIFMLLGPSGSGKSTLLRIMSGLEKSFEGEVSFGAGVSPRDASFVFQQFALLPWLDVWENIALGLGAQKLAEAERKNIVERELEEFGLKKFAKAYPKELSGGMRQRVGIARALAVSPKLIFLDEPFSELDSFTAEELRKEILKIWAERQVTIVMVTHLIEEAVELGDRIAVFTPRPGKIEKIIQNRLPRPRARRSENFYKLEDELARLIKP